MNKWFLRVAIACLYLTLFWIALVGISGAKMISVLGSVANIIAYFLITSANDRRTSSV